MRFLMQLTIFMENKIFEKIIAEVRSLGVFKVNIINTNEIKTKREFRDMCFSNACGLYGKCHMCPPDVGEIDLLIDKIKNYDNVLVYQTVHNLEDGYDFEGMMEAKRKIYKVARKLRTIFSNAKISKTLHLCAGGCGVCETCAKQTGEPCRFPALAMPSLEAYGVDVSSLAKSANMQYVNGKDTVTYFGAVLFSIGGEQNG